MENTFINHLHNRITTVQNLNQTINVLNKQTTKGVVMGNNKINQLINILQSNIENCWKYYPIDNVSEVLVENLIGWNKSNQ